MKGSATLAMVVSSACMMVAIMTQTVRSARRDPGASVPGATKAGAAVADGDPGRFRIDGRSMRRARGRVRRSVRGQARQLAGQRARRHVDAEEMRQAALAL